MCDHGQRTTKMYEMLPKEEHCLIQSMRQQRKTLQKCLCLAFWRLQHREIDYDGFWIRYKEKLQENSGETFLTINYTSSQFAFALTFIVELKFSISEDVLDS